MNLGKLSGLKGLVSHSHGKRRFKGDLTADMISPPLGDFRHTMHVGRGGDVFGDTSFLSNHGGWSSGDGDAASMPDKAEGFLSRTLRHVRRTPDRPRGDPKDLSPPPPPISPIVKNAVSLPRLDVDPPRGSPVKVPPFSTPQPATDCRLSYGLESGFVTLPRLSRSERQYQQATPTCSPEITHDSLCFSSSPSGSLASFTVDLGPSLLSEVFGLIDGRGDGQQDLEDIAPSEEPDLVCHLPLSRGVDSYAAMSLVDSLLREDFSGGWGDEAGRGRAQPEQRMAPARFQRAADVLARHYGSPGSRPSARVHSSSPHQSRAPYLYPDDDDEIKV
ncbi:cdc42 effector protein 1 [Denticeps clupeoides]|uniref:CRIB domain-containing protein n=1 Tax=Denticeps clupeoides TaxID=299321 RepID=A0AAY4C5H8_9TELE|nr:cdc42 effector protein 1-like [Denticeps clupeoides]